MAAVFGVEATDHLGQVFGTYECCEQGVVFGARIAAGVGHITGAEQLVLGTGDVVRLEEDAQGVADFFLAFVGRIRHTTHT
jgi:hypothetical protein